MELLREYWILVMTLRLVLGMSYRGSIMDSKPIGHGSIPCIPGVFIIPMPNV